MAPGRVRGADGVDGGEALRVPEGLDRREAWVEAEVAVQVQDILLGHGDAGSFSIIDDVPAGSFSLTASMSWSASPVATRESSTTVTPCSLPAASATAAFIRSSRAPLFTHAASRSGYPSGATWR